MTKLILLSKRTLLFVFFNISLTIPQNLQGNCFNNEIIPESDIKSESNKSDNEKRSELVIVIDPGHGGKDPGASYGAINEKDIVLEIALILKYKIENAIPGSRVVLTRDRDVFLPLYARARIANESDASLFISLHCNSYPNDINVKGAEVFVLGQSMRSYDLDVALRENSSVYLESDYENNYEWYESDSPEAYIFLSAFENLFLQESLSIAGKLSNSNLISAVTKQRGVRQAGFLVMRNAAMPAILIETGFITNSNDRKMMMDPLGQNQIASWISNVLMEHFVFDKRGIAMK
jgi:N-acetylmuramoyl-L-alanine amidase